MASMLVLARLYAPSSFGIFALFMSFVGLAVAVASLRYDAVIVLPHSDAEARSVQRLASRSIAVVSGLFGVGCYLFRTLLQTELGISHVDVWIGVGALTVFVTAQTSNRQFWLTRQARFRLIAQNRLLAAVSIAIFQLAGGLTIGGFQGLFLGNFAGQLVTFLVVNRRTREVSGSLPPDAPPLRVVARKYRKMPLLNGPHALLDTVRSAGTNVLIGRVSVGSLGQYSAAYRLTFGPAALIVGSAVQVLLKRMADTKPGETRAFVLKTMLVVGAFVVPLSVIYYWMAPWLIPALLGSDWVSASSYVKALIPWVAVYAITTPVSNIFIVSNSQGLFLMSATVVTAAQLIFLMTTTQAFPDAVATMGLLLAALQACQGALAAWVAGRYDSRATNVES